MSKVILITGSSSSLAHSLVSNLSLSDNVIYTTYSSHPQSIPGSESLKLNLTSKSDCDRVIKTIFKQHGRLDVVVNIAGLGYSGPGITTPQDKLSELLTINIQGNLNLIQSYYALTNPQFRRQYIAICSLSGLVAFPGHAAYSASKFGLRALCLSLYHELIGQSFFVTCLHPGAIIRPESPPPATSARERIPLLKLILPFTTPNSVSRKIVSLMNSSQPPPEAVVGRDAILLYNLFRYLPASIWHHLQAYVWQKQA